MSRTAFITGITGQDGTYLAELLLEKGYEVTAWSAALARENFERIGTSATAITLHQADLLDQLLADRRAARRASRTRSTTSPPMSFVADVLEPAGADRRSSPALGVTRMLEAMRDARPDGIRFYQASSSEMFGKVRETPQNETTPFYPRSPYGVAKVYGHCITVNYRESYGLLRLLGHPLQPRVARGAAWSSSPARSPHGVAAIKLGLANELRARQPRRAARLGLRRRLRRGDVADAAAGRARRLRRRHRRDPHGARAGASIAFGHVGLDWQTLRVRGPGPRSARPRSTC